MARTKDTGTNPSTAAIGKTMDDAMVAIERDDPRFKGVLPKDYARPALEKHTFSKRLNP